MRPTARLPQNPPIAQPVGCGRVMEGTKRTSAEAPWGYGFSPS